MINSFYAKLTKITYCYSTKQFSHNRKLLIKMVTKVDLGAFLGHRLKLTWVPKELISIYIYLKFKIYQAKISCRAETCSIFPSPSSSFLLLSCSFSSLPLLHTKYKIFQHCKLIFVYERTLIHLYFTFYWIKKVKFKQNLNN